MLSPETWDFKPPRHHFFVSKSNFKKAEVPAVIRTHYFNHAISVVLPDTVTVPDYLRNCLLEDTDYYLINALRICDLINKEFIEAFVKKGQVTLLAIGNKIDLDNSICITPTGDLIISLITKDYQALGLEGKASSFNSHIHYVKIDLKDEKFAPGKKNYERVRQALEERFDQKFDVIAAWDPPDIKLCPSSLASWFYERGYNVKLCHQKFSGRTEYSLTIPTLQDGCNMDEFFEWLGLFSIGGDLSNEKMDDYVNTYKCPSSSTYIGQVQYLQWTGFFMERQSQKMYNMLKEYVLSRQALPWLSLHVQGFADSPVNWGLKEHTFFTDGDHSYTIIFQPKGESIIRQV